MNQRNTLITGVIFSALAVALGAFGAHALETILSQRGKSDTWDLAVQYQMIHGIALVLNGIMIDENQRWFRIASLLFFAGVLCFSGSLFILSLTNLIFPLVLITPLGGLLLIAGWITMMVGVAFKYKKS